MRKERMPHEGQSIDFAKLTNPEGNPNDLKAVFNWFERNVGTTLDAMFATGILRNSITYYVAHLENAGLLQPIKKDFDRTTHRLAKHYTANKSLWLKQRYVQLQLFGEDLE